MAITTTTYDSKEIRQPGVDKSQYVRVPITVAAAQTAMRSGTILGKITASGKYAAYNDGHSDGTEVARGILVQDNVDAAGLGADQVCSMYISGYFLKNQLVGLDANGETDMGGRTYAFGGAGKDVFRI